MSVRPPVRGDKKAIAAVAHSILVAAWHIPRDGVRYRELGPDHFDRLDQDRLIPYHTRRLADLGILVPAAARHRQPHRRLSEDLRSAGMGREFAHMHPDEKA